MTSNITPALQIDDKKNLTAEEFQKQLCSWLENRGLLCELRAYFRSNMIEVLKNTTLGTSLSSKVKQTISPKMQAMNLMIAEYFIYSQYHFSLCVFCTEVSLNNILQTTQCTAEQQKISLEGTPFKFTEKEVYDILEAMGILRHNQRAQKVYSSYCKLNEPLISYFLPLSSPSIISFEPTYCFEVAQDADGDPSLGNIDKLLSNSNISPTEISQLKHYIKLIWEKQHEKHLKAVDNLKDQYKNQLKKYKGKVSDIQKAFDNERKQFQDEIILMRSELEDLHVQNQIRRDRDLIEFSQIAKEQVQQTEVVNFEEKSTQCIAEDTKAIAKLDKDQQGLTNSSLEATVLQHVVQQLEKENTNLRIDNFNYCEQIDELANRASILMTELNISQQHVARLSNLLQNPPSIFTRGNAFNTHIQNPHYTGAGEECNSANTKRATPSNYRHLHRSKKSSTKITSSSENSSGTLTPTDDLLLEAKRKLRNLELESEDIDRKIRSFTERYDFAQSAGQKRYGGACEKSFKFNNEVCDIPKDEVFEFGGSEKQSDSNADPGHESQTSLGPASTSHNDINQSDVSESD